MGEESVKGANMGVILIIFAAILALGLIIFMLARNMANTGLTNVSEKLEAANQSEFSDFDGSVVVGQRVQAALAGFKGKKVAVLIATQGLIDKTSVKWEATSPAAKNVDKDAISTALLTNTAVIAGHDKQYYAFALVPSRNPADNSIIRTADTRVGAPASSSGQTNDKQLMYIQYNALLEGTTEKGVVASANRNSAIWWNDGAYVFDGSFRQSSGKTMMDMLFANTTTNGYTEMIPGAARFNANLLKDANGVILGVVFQQIGA